MTVATQAQIKALTIGHEIRTERARLKAELKAGQHNPIQLLASPPRPIQSMKIEAFLLALPAISRVKANTVLHRVGLSPLKPVGELTSRQALSLARYLRQHHPKALRRSA